MLAWTLILALQESPDVVPVPAPAEPHACWAFDVRAGASAWNLGGFDALTAAGSREIDDDVLLEGDLEISAAWRDWEIGVGGARSDGKDLRTQVGWIRLSPPSLLTFAPALPFEARVSAGLLFGSLDVDVSGFGDFDDATGFLARLSVETPRHSPFGLALWVDLRALEFDYAEPALGGDDAVGGATFALGLSVLARF